MWIFSNGTSYPIASANIITLIFLTYGERKTIPEKK